MPFSDPEKKREYNRNYARRYRELNLTKCRAWQRKSYRKTRGANPTNRARIAAYQREYRRRNKEKMAAYWTVKAAIKRGKIVKPVNCSLCGGTERIQAHHHRGYAREFRLDIIWLCLACHRKEHPPDTSALKPRRRLGS